MKIKETETVTRQVVKQVLCDKCGDEVKHDTYEHYEVEVTHGEYIPHDGHNSYTAAMDLCEPCADALKVLLAANGYKLGDEE